MKKARLVLPGGEVVVNFTKSWVDWVDGLFKDATAPMLIDYHWMFRPITISSMPRIQMRAPRFAMMTFDTRRDTVRRVDSFPEGAYMELEFRERYALMIPLPADPRMMGMEKLDFRECP